ncbi:oligosaccharide flippase family protein [Cellulomonas sp. P5_E12]
MEPTTSSSTPGGDTLGRGLAWSFLNNSFGRIGSFVTGIVVARLVVPEDLGTYAAALVVLNVMLSMNELGVSLAIVRHVGSIRRIAPTVQTIALVSSVVLFVTAWFTAPAFASLLGAPEATGVIRLMSVGVLVDALTAVPVALMTRAFMQARRLRIDMVGFAVGTPITILLAAAGAGAWSLAWGAVASNLVTAALSLLWSPEHIRPGFDRTVARELLVFGLPLAGSSVLLFSLVNVDYVIVGATLGATALGLYTIAFNVSSWPSTLVVAAVRRVSMPAFARFEKDGRGDEGFRRGMVLVVAVTAPLLVLLACNGQDVIVFLYGERWAAAAVAVPALAVLGMTRIVVELVYDYLVAVGHTVHTLWVHAVWLAILVPVLLYGAHHGGIRGVALGHAAVCIVVVLPLLGVVAHRNGISLLPLLRGLWRPVVGSVLVAGASFGAQAVLTSPFLVLLAAGVVGLLLYAVVALRFVRTQLKELLEQGAESWDPVVADAGPGTP